MTTIDGNNGAAVASLLTSLITAVQQWSKLPLYKKGERATQRSHNIKEVITSLFYPFSTSLAFFRALRMEKYTFVFAISQAREIRYTYLDFWLVNSAACFASLLYDIYFTLLDVLVSCWLSCNATYLCSRGLIRP